MQARKDATEYDRLIILLLEFPDIDINKQDYSGKSALMIASARGSKHVVKVLLGTEGCDPNLVSRDGDTAHSLALSSGHMEIADLLKDGPLDPNRVRWTTIHQDMML